MSYWSYKSFIQREHKKLFPEYKPPPSPPKPALIYGEITNSEILALMPKEYLNPNNNTVYKTTMDFWDVKYRLTSLNEIKSGLEWFKQVYITIKPESGWHDCDDNAQILLGRIKEWTSGLCFGLLVTIAPAHMKCFFIDYMKKVYEVESPATVKPLYSLVHKYLV